MVSPTIKSILHIYQNTKCFRTKLTSHFLNNTKQSLNNHRLPTITNSSRAPCLKQNWKKLNKNSITWTHPAFHPHDFISALCRPLPFIFFYRENTFVIRLNSFTITIPTSVFCISIVTTSLSSLVNLNDWPWVDSYVKGLARKKKTNICRDKKITFNKIEVETNTRWLITNIRQNIKGDYFAKNKTFGFRSSMFEN